MNERRPGRGCKTCRCDLSDWVDQKIREGKPDSWVSKGLADQGVTISKTSIYRHRTMCLDIRSKPKGEAPSSDADDVTPTPTIVDAKAIIAEARRQAGGDAHLVSFILRDITQTHLATVKQSVDDYAAGAGPNPLDDLRGLQIVHNILREECVITHLQIDANAPVDEKANRVAQGVIEGMISPANGEKLLSVLHRQLELLEYKQIVDQVDSLKARIESKE